MDKEGDGDGGSKDRVEASMLTQKFIKKEGKR